jgi:hypothetical protein
MFESMKDDRQNFVKCFRFSKFEKVKKELLPTDNQKENTQWRRSIKIEEIMALTLRLVHIPYNLLSSSSSE